ncbi:PREDICTED: protein NIM1-INTERACTING 3 [Tarenaya hassleriana]|uniref:protein NIM1-INTERACTING 3 n=1 Tax=Tarenaya hassleriana TaxID=28532 RepID=UPI00053C20E8|nr:PREDICTED: protein NIM1-INTERACTING 3 [Tarenaya hassleriana]
MEGDRKKMKMEEKEEDKMEKMYAFLKHAREMRKYLVSSTEREEKRVHGEGALPHKNPSFQLEVLSENAELNNTEKAINASPPTSKKDVSQKKRDGSEGSSSDLDLNLSL